MTSQRSSFSILTSSSDKLDSTALMTCRGVSVPMKFCWKFQNYSDPKLDCKSSITKCVEHLWLKSVSQKLWFSPQNFSLTQFGASSGRGSIISENNVLPSQSISTVGVFKGERVAIKKISKKKVRRNLCGEGQIPEKKLGWKRVKAVGMLRLTRGNREAWNYRRLSEKSRSKFNQNFTDNKSKSEVKIIVQLIINFIKLTFPRLLLIKYPHL